MIENQPMPSPRKKIKRILIKRKDDILTALEKNWRDNLCKPLTRILWKLGITANHITVISFILLVAPITMHFLGKSLLWQFWLLVIIGISDVIDGPMARNNNNVTIFGTWMDHIRDGALIVWASYLIYHYQLLSGQVLIVIWTLQIILVWTTIKDFLIRYIKGLPNDTEQRLVSNFSLDNLQASVIGRLQFFWWAMSYAFLIGSLMLEQPSLASIGYTLIILEIIFAALNILGSYHKTLAE